LRRIWIDLDNSPHVPLFASFIQRLQQEGWQVKVTARNFAQTLDLVEQFGVKAVAVGKHAGKSKLKKILNLPIRAMQLISELRGFKPEIALSHGSRTQAIAAKILGVPKVTMFDYEWSEMKILGFCSSVMFCPEFISKNRLSEAGFDLKKIRFYKGLKEDMYVREFLPNPNFKAELGINQNQKLITIRPPGIIGNYHNENSEKLCRELVLKAIKSENNFVVILPKTQIERKFIDEILTTEHKATVLIPDKAINGLQLLYHSDYCFSGGGTMNREAVALGKHAFSIFTGAKGEVDEILEKSGLLTFLNTTDEVCDINFDNRVENKKHFSEDLQKQLIDLLNSILS